MNTKSLLSAILAAVILVSGSAWAGEGCCKSQKKETTCKKENKGCGHEKKCDKAKDPNCPKTDAKPAA